MDELDKKIIEAYDSIVNESVGGPGSYEDEKKIAMKMKAMGYKMVILFPSEMNVSPLYVKNTLAASQLMRKEFKTVKDYEIKKISEFVGEKNEDLKEQKDVTEIANVENAFDNVMDRRSDMLVALNSLETALSKIPASELGKKFTGKLATMKKNNHSLKKELQHLQKAFSHLSKTMKV